MTPAQSDRIWEIVFRAAERDPKVRALLVAQPDGGDSNPGSATAALLSGPTAQTPCEPAVAHSSGGLA